MKVSVVVCAKNEERYIGTCLKCLKAQTVKPEIIVVDGHSTDKTVKIARKYADKIVKDNKKGLGDARDVGCKAATGEIIAYCDADALPPKYWVENVIKLMKGAACVSGPLVPYDGSWHVKANLTFWANWMPQFLAFFGFHNVWGANMAVRKEVLNKCKFKHAFLEDFYMGEQLRNTKLRCKFSGKLAIPISSRRFWREGFYEICLKHYLSHVVKEKLTGKRDGGYYQ